MARKSTALALPNIHILRRANLEPPLPILDEHITPQKFVETIAEVEEERKIGAVYVVCDEIGGFLKSAVQDMSVIEVLTEGYMGNKPLATSTLSRGKTISEKPCLNMLGATIPEGLKTMPRYALEGGFFGRVILVHQVGVERRIAWPQITPEALEERDKLVNDIREIRSLQGEMYVTPAAKEWFTAWYEDVGLATTNNPYLRPFEARKHDTVLKLGIAISASQRNNLRLEQEDLEDALRLINNTQQYLEAVMEQVQSTSFGEEIDRVRRAIAKAGRIKKSILLRNFSHRFSAAQLKEILESLEMAGLVRVQLEGRGRGATTYIVSLASEE